VTVEAHDDRSLRFSNVLFTSAPKQAAQSSREEPNGVQRKNVIQRSALQSQPERKGGNAAARKRNTVPAARRTAAQLGSNQRSTPSSAGSIAVSRRDVQPVKFKRPLPKRGNGFFSGTIRRESDSRMTGG
jgi:hypothetical protein